jgi:lipopolysaccharide/colanic/teichoic acid biosynthesis glycosyltransferase
MFSFLKRRSSDQGWLAWPAASALGSRRALLLSPRQFEREVARERVRSTRRSIPFCVLQIQLVGLSEAGNDRDEILSKSNGRAGRVLSLKKQTRKLVDLLHHNLRMTDEKGIVSSTRYGVLLVDTPEMGGRAVLDRMTVLAGSAGLDIRLSLQVHDPEGFGEWEEETALADLNSDRRRGDSDVDQWFRNPVQPIKEIDQSWQVKDEGQVSIVDDELIQPRPWLSNLTKRAIDVIGAGSGLILTAPLIGAAMIAIKLDDGGPVFFCQTREGRNGRPFTIYKLRSMVVDAEKTQAALRSASHREGPAFKISRDPRVTPIGRFLRATCLDELPQFINVLIGDMSLVGPRPLPWHESRACERWHRRRLDVRPGLTCIWQINKGKAQTFDDWMRMDLRYIDRFGLLQDLRLIAQTVIVPVTGRGGE